MANTLDQFTEATVIGDTDLLHVKSSTGVNSDKKITGANAKIAFATAITGFPDINDQTGTTYEFVAGDLTDCVVANNASVSTYSIPDSLGSVGDTLNLYNKGLGILTVDMAGTDTLNTSDNNCEQYKAVTALKIAATVWAVIGGSA